MGLAWASVDGSTITRPLRLTVAEAASGRAAVVKVEGEFDLSVEALFDEVVIDGVVQNGHASVVLDLSGLAFIDLAGVHALVRARAAAHARGSRLVLLRPSRPTQRLLELCGLTDGFELTWDTLRSTAEL